MSIISTSSTRGAPIGAGSIVIIAAGSAMLAG